MKQNVHRAWLRELRIKKDYTMGQLAEKVGSAAQYIGDIEHGRRNPSFKLALALSEELNFPMERLYVDALERQYRGKEERKQA